MLLENLLKAFENDCKDNALMHGDRISVKRLQLSYSIFSTVDSRIVVF